MCICGWNVGMGFDNQVCVFIIEYVYGIFFVGGFCVYVDKYSIGNFVQGCSCKFVFYSSEWIIKGFYEQVVYCIDDQDIFIFGCLEEIGFVFGC